MELFPPKISGPEDFEDFWELQECFERSSRERDRE